jgi:hypothetical protein
VIGRLPQLAASFVGPEGEPDEHYKAAIKLRFVQWVSDVYLQPHDQRWLDYQEEIGLRHMPAKKNRTDNAQTPSVVPQRYLLAFTAIVITTIGGFLAESGRPKEDLVRMQDTWTRAVLLAVTLWSRSYAKDDLW